jgi:serine protease Do
MRRDPPLKFLAVLLALAAVPRAVAAQAQPQELNLRHTVVVDVVQKTKDAVVNISTTYIVQQRMNRGPFWQDIVNVPANSLGSGFIVHPDGYVVTNNHVIDRAREISVELADGRKLPAELISADPDNDLAILKVNSDKPLPTLPLGDSADILIGEPTIAVGNPLGYSHSVSTGIVSAVHRELKDDETGLSIKDLVQTDAAINPGNSGGPLLNAYGQVIGINTAIRSDAQNIGFAIQVNRLRELIPVLMNPASAKKITVPLKLTERRKVTPPSNVDTQVLTDKGAVVKTINGQAPANIVDAYALLLRSKVGQKFDVVTDKGTESITPKASPMPDAVVQARKRLGLVVEPMTPRLAAKIDSRWEKGVLVTEVLRGSVAARAGLRPGDIVARLGPYGVATLDDFAVLLQHLPDSGRVRVAIIRDNQVGYGMLEL